jgi:hypothetical protein
MVAAKPREFLAKPEDQQLCAGNPFGPHQPSIPNNQRGVQFDVLTDLVRASRPHFTWHLNKACSRAATHILAEQTPGFMQSACPTALALAVATKAGVAPLKRASANLDTERLLIVSKYHAQATVVSSKAMAKSRTLQYQQHTYIQTVQPWRRATWHSIIVSLNVASQDMLHALSQMHGHSLLISKRPACLYEFLLNWGQANGRD